MARLRALRSLSLRMATHCTEETMLTILPLAPDKPTHFSPAMIRAAERLYFMLEKYDPSAELLEWEELSEDHKEMYCFVIDGIIPEILEAAKEAGILPIYHSGDHAHT